MVDEFDPKPLADLASDLDVATAREIIASYLDEAPKLLREAADALQARDVVAFRRAVHTLKSTSANMGAMRLAESCKALEVGASEGGLPEDPSAVQALERQLAAIRPRLASWNG